jgi:hypothetical protein
MKIKYRIDPTRIFDGWHDTAGLDARASAGRYADLCEVELARAFPHAIIELYVACAGPGYSCEGATTEQIEWASIILDRVYADTDAWVARC